MKCKQASLQGGTGDPLVAGMGLFWSNHDAHSQGPLTVCNYNQALQRPPEQDQCGKPTRWSLCAADSSSPFGKHTCLSYSARELTDTHRAGMWPKVRQVSHVAPGLRSQYLRKSWRDLRCRTRWLTCPVLCLWRWKHLTNSIQDQLNFPKGQNFLFELFRGVLFAHTEIYIN